jgi:MFS family permease
VRWGGVAADADARRFGGGLFYGWVIVVVGAMVAFSSGPGQSFVFSIFIDSMIEDTGFSRSTISALYTVSTGVSALMVAVVSRLADRWGARSNLILVGVAFGAACFGMAFSAGLAAFYLSFAGLRALGQGSLTINSTLLVNQWFVTRRGRAIALMGLGFPLSNAVLPPLSRWLIDTYGWREAYGVLGVLVMLLIIPASVFLVRNRPEDVGLYPDGADEPPLIEQSGTHSPEAAARRPVLTSVAFWMLAIPLATPGLVVTALVFHQTSIFAENGLSATTAAAVFVIFAFASATTSMVAGFVVDRVGPSKLFVFAMVALFVVCGLALVVNSVWMAALYVTGMGVAGGSQRIVQGVIWAHYYGRFGLGKVQGAAMMVGITGAAVGPLPLSLFRDLTGNYDVGIMAMAMLPLLSIAVVLIGHPERRIAAGLAASDGQVS